MKERKRPYCKNIEPDENDQACFGSDYIDLYEIREFDTYFFRIILGFLTYVPQLKICTKTIKRRIERCFL